MMGNYFTPIDASQQGWEDELKKRQALNAQIDWMNQFAQANANNKYVQSALLQQYMGMMSPQQPDPSDQLGLAMDFLASGDPNLKQAGYQILQSNPLTQAYMGGMSPQGQDIGQQSNVIQDYLNQMQGANRSDMASGLRQLAGQEGIGAADKTEADKLAQYYGGGGQLGSMWDSVRHPVQTYQFMKDEGVKTALPFIFDDDLRRKYWEQIYGNDYTNLKSKYGIE